MANIFNDNSGIRGLKVGGQIRSRVEGEGKFQLTVEEFLAARLLLFQLVGDSALAGQVLGNGWTIQLQDRYLTKDSAGNPLKDALGFPIPDPMVDTYYDNDTLDAAKLDMAIRYRWTEINKTGAWNFKPGMGRVVEEGIVYRVEYGLDTTDDRPDSIAKFANSNHPLNPFRLIRTKIPGAIATDFLKTSVKLTDTRYKFNLRHTSGLAIEVSLDDVTAASLKAAEGSPLSSARFYQLEMDIDHLATQSQNNGTLNSQGMSGSQNFYSNAPGFNQFIGTLGANAFLDGRPVLHSEADLDPSGALLTLKQAEFQLASTAILSLRDHLLKTGWIPGAQKYAFAAHALDLIKRNELAPSVQAALRPESTSTNAQKTCVSLLEAK